MSLDHLDQENDDHSQPAMPLTEPSAFDEHTHAEIRATSTPTTPEPHDEMMVPVSTESTSETQNDEQTQLSATPQPLGPLNDDDELFGTEDNAEEDTEKRAAIVVPSPSPQEKKVSPPHQDKALHYLTRKATHHLPQDDDPKSNGAHPDDATIQLSRTKKLLPDLVAPKEEQQIAQPQVTTLSITTPAISSNRAIHSYRRRKFLLRYISRKHIRQSRFERQRASNRFWGGILYTCISLLVLFMSLSGAATYAAIRFNDDTQTKYLPRVITLHDLTPRDNLKMYDSKGIPIGQMMDQGIHTTVTLQQISPLLVNATVATEDKNFWTNPGVDILRIIQAALEDLRNQRVVQGGSTITQQLIKTLVVGNETSAERKLQEIVLTPQVNSRYTKQDIMEMYLNSIYYGQQAYGIDAAASIYFGLEDKPDKPAALQLDLAQAAMLAGIPNSPYANDPRVHPDAAFQRFQIVLDAMLKEHYITKVQALDAIKEAQSPSFFKHPVNIVNRAPHFFNFVLRQLAQQYHLTLQQLSLSDMSVYTTLDIGLQDKIQKIAQDHIAQLRDAKHITNSAEVLIDFHTGAIRSLLGSIDYDSKTIDGKYDVATQAFRQPGSSFKPYAYVTAFAQGASPAQAINDTPLAIYTPGQKPFIPVNYDHRFHGHMTLRCALQNSLNIPAVKVLQHVGIDATIQTAKDMGITEISSDGPPGYSLVLGGAEVHLIDHTSAYGTFANNGVHVPYYGIEKVVFAHTHQTIAHQTTRGKQAISPQLAYMMTSVLSDNSSRIADFGDCNVLQLYSNSQYACYSGYRGQVRPAAAKTGTTNDFRDNWTVGYTTDYVMGVWAGNNDNSEMNNVSGVDGAAPIWHDSMLVAEQGHPIRNFTNPGGLQWATVTYPDGVQTSDWFLPGTVPAFAPPTPTTNPTPGPTPPPIEGKPQPPAPSARSFCPSSYTFAFPPPGNASSSPGWW